MWHRRATPPGRWLLGPRLRGDGVAGNPEHLGGELRIDLDELRRDHGPQQAERVGGGGGRHRHLLPAVELKARMLDALGERVPGMRAREPEAFARAIEGEQAAVGDERDRTAWPVHVRRARSGRADEIDLWHQGAAAVL